MKTFGALLFAGIIAVSQPSAFAHEEVYTAVLNGSNENPANGSPGTGFVTLTMDLDLFVMTLDVDFSNLQGTVTAAHVHAGTATPLSGTALIATQLPTLPGFPTGSTSGNYQMTIDLVQQSSYNPDYFAANGGSVALVSSAFYNALREGRNYLEIETSSFSGGEIRGFLVPEPSTTALLVAGAAAIGMAVRRSRVASNRR